MTYELYVNTTEDEDSNFEEQTKPNPRLVLISYRIVFVRLGVMKFMTSTPTGYYNYNTVNTSQLN